MSWLELGSERNTLFAINDLPVSTIMLLVNELGCCDMLLSSVDDRIQMCILSQCLIVVCTAHATGHDPVICSCGLGVYHACTPENAGVKPYWPKTGSLP